MVLGLMSLHAVGVAGAWSVCSGNHVDARCRSMEGLGFAAVVEVTACLRVRSSDAVVGLVDVIVWSPA